MRETPRREPTKRAAAIAAHTGQPVDTGLARHPAGGRRAGPNQVRPPPGTSYAPRWCAGVAMTHSERRGKVTSLENAKTFAVGIAQTPALALLAQQDIVVELSREMPDTNYTIDLSRSQGLLSAGAVTFKAKTRSTVTYTIRAVVALGAGSLVLLARY